MNLQKRSYQPELLDGENIPFDDIKINMQELSVINTWLGGHKITLNGFKKLVGNRKSVTVCEIGCGGGDNLKAIANFCIRHNIILSIVGIDKNKNCIDVAKELFDSRINTNWIIADYATVNFKQKPDIIFSSLFCHHFTDNEIRFQLEWMKENSELGFFINDLHRNYLAYYSILFLTKIFSQSYLVKYDAALSVARGWRKKEWIALLALTNIQYYTISWKWAFRYLILVQHAKTK
ncbi:methyltransferase domain-containing protein [Hydrotalea sp.]|uniref:methyltransferase domain-containing protein n=1 Tax=Hydrotalea sp. TaxID=2881279 RepID=UPI003D0A2F03